MAASWVSDVKMHFGMEAVTKGRIYLWSRSIVYALPRRVSDSATAEDAVKFIHPAQIRFGILGWFGSCVDRCFPKKATIRNVRVFSVRQQRSHCFLIPADNSPSHFAVNASDLTAHKYEISYDLFQRVLFMEIGNWMLRWRLSSLVIIIHWWMLNNIKQAMR